MHGSRQLQNIIEGCSIYIWRKDERGCSIEFACKHGPRQLQYVKECCRVTVMFTIKPICRISRSYAYGNRGRVDRKEDIQWNSHVSMDLDDSSHESHVTD